MRVFYTHGFGGSLAAQPEIDEVFPRRGHEVLRVRVPFHENPLALAARFATMTFGDFCRLIDETAASILDRARSFAPDEYAVIGDSLGGFISLVAAERDPRISHCVLLSSSGDIANAGLHLDRLLPGLGALGGALNPASGGGLRVQSHKAIGGASDFQADFDRVNTFAPERLLRVRRLLVICDRRDPVMPRDACVHLTGQIRGARAIFPCDHATHHTIGEQALERWVVPFLENRPLTLGDRLACLLGRGAP
ncbi:MAG: alpha/beta hydrolase fold [Candidatus Binatota bacterium]|jgi:pimeloyl-ACP methyl ester carboxylesterase|nr:alpha/beta hydrolase fold [Candidatus Binatota bacterium]